MDEISPRRRKQSNPKKYIPKDAVNSSEKENVNLARKQREIFESGSAKKQGRPLTQRSIEDYV